MMPAEVRAASDVTPLRRRCRCVSRKLSLRDHSSAALERCAGPGVRCSDPRTPLVSRWSIRSLAEAAELLVGQRADVGRSEETCCDDSRIAERSETSPLCLLAPTSSSVAPQTRV